MNKTGIFVHKIPMSYIHNKNQDEITVDKMLILIKV